MQKVSAETVEDELRPEYDLAQLRGGVRRKYYQQARAGTHLVLIEPDLAKTFPDRASVNRALRRWFRQRMPPLNTRNGPGERLKSDPDGWR